MANRLQSIGLVVALAAAGCAPAEVGVRAESEPEAPPLRIEDQSADAPPPPPPSAAPSDAQPSAPAPPPVASPALAAPAPPPPSAPTAPPPAALPAEAPPSTGWTQEYPSGRWVYANSYGWMWVPANAATSDSEGVPYTYLYTPTYGWTWYISPWGPGPYHYGVWVRRPWQPVGWRGAWVARPGVVVRLGGPAPRHYHYRDHGGGRHRR